MSGHDDQIEGLLPRGILERPLKPLDVGGAAGLLEHRWRGVEPHEPSAVSCHPGGSQERSRAAPDVEHDGSAITNGR